MRREREEARKEIDEQLAQEAEIKKANFEELLKEESMYDPLDFIEDDWRDRWRRDYLDDSLSMDEDLWDRLDRYDADHDFEPDIDLYNDWDFL